MSTPAPDPAPHTGHKPVRVDWAYEYITTAEDKTTHRIIPGVWYVCHVPATGRRFCVRFRESEAANR